MLPECLNQMVQLQPSADGEQVHVPDVQQPVAPPHAEAPASASPYVKRTTFLEIVNLLTSNQNREHEGIDEGVYMFGHVNYMKLRNVISKAAQDEEWAKLYAC